MSYSSFQKLIFRTTFKVEYLTQDNTRRPLGKNLTNIGLFCRFFPVNVYLGHKDEFTYFAILSRVTTAEATFLHNLLLDDEAG